MSQEPLYFKATRLDGTSEHGRDFREVGTRSFGKPAAALVVRDLISPEHFKVLYGSWEEILGDLSS
jgi:hypothetical protein